MSSHTPEGSTLGKKTVYDAVYAPDKLFPIARKKNRDAIGVNDASLPFHGYDFWNHYEVSWLNAKGKPEIAIAEIIYSCDSKNIIESKSMKLYFNSLNQTAFSSWEDVQKIIYQDLLNNLGGGELSVKLFPLSHFKQTPLHPTMSGKNIDDTDIACDTYHCHPAFLKTENTETAETLCSDLLRSNCLITNQPDWGSVEIQYKGKKINEAGLLKYLVSFRNDNEFHEQCIEKIFTHVMQYCKPTELTVHGRSTRRGGIDINSIRSTKKTALNECVNNRLCRQ